MRLLIFAAAISVASVALLPQIIGQVAPDSIKHITTAPPNGVRGGARLNAADIVRDLPYPSLVHLKGNVEIRANGFILHAEEADYNENTGEVEARGTVKVTPYPPLK